jgi:hypothetical protein
MNLNAAYIYCSLLNIGVLELILRREPLFGLLLNLW